MLTITQDWLCCYIQINCVVIFRLAVLLDSATNNNSRLAVLLYSATNNNSRLAVLLHSATISGDNLTSENSSLRTRSFLHCLKTNLTSLLTIYYTQWLPIYYIQWQNADSAAIYNKSVINFYIQQIMNLISSSLAKNKKSKVARYYSVVAIWKLS